MKNKKNVLIVIFVVIVIGLIGLTTYHVLSDENKLSSSEKKWINEHIKTVQNVNVIKDINIFGNTDTGVFYEFLNDLKLKYKLEINPKTFNYGESVSGVTLGIKASLSDNDYIFYTDHYVLVSKKDEIVANYQDFANKRIGILSSDLSRVSAYLKEVNNLNLVSEENKEMLIEAFKTGEDIDYMIVPLTIYLDEILKNDYYIVNHLSDVPLYYTISGDNDDILTSILKKFYYKWSKENLDAYIKREEFTLFTECLGISETEVDAMQSVTYRYGFVNNSPYEVIMSGNYGGIMAMYLHDFSEFSKTELEYVKFSNLNKFKKAINNGDVDLYFNYYNLTDNLYSINSHILLEFSVVANISNPVVINSLNSLNDYEVYVQKDSALANYLINTQGLNLKTYENSKELKKLNKQNVVIVLDKNLYDLYQDTYLTNYTERFTDNINFTYDFKSKTSSAFYKLFSKFVMVSDSKEMINRGMYNHDETVKNGNILGTIAKYILILLVVILLVFIIFYKSSKRIKIAKKIKKEDKVKFIDQLTSLKNRNYLNEYIHNWNNNTVYPQTMIVVDLNNVQFVNDTLGYDEGDKQIKAAANILIKTQLDNSDIMRTDGNEFLIYLVGYTQKQVTNYIHKLNKEFKKLPYEYGAEFGYSMINDNVKTIEDAILEATDEMKKQKRVKDGDVV